MQSPGGEKGQGRWTPCGWHLGRIHQGQGWSMGRLHCGLVTHTGASRGRSGQVGMEPANTPGSGWAEDAAAPPGHRAWEVHLRGAPGPGGQALSLPAWGQGRWGLVAASDPRVLEESWAGWEVSGRGLPAGPSTQILSPNFPPEPQIWGTSLVGAAACQVLSECWGARGKVRGRLGSRGGT